MQIIMLLRSRSFLLGVLTISVVGVMAVRESGARAEAKQQLLEFRTRIVTAGSRQFVEAQFSELNAGRLRLAKVRPDLWIVQTPIEFGAVNWDLYIDFVQDRPVLLRVRSADSVDHHPPKAPSDVRIESAETPKRP
jgi:hypothetical protein